MNKTFSTLAFHKHSSLYSSSDQLKHSLSSTMPKQQQSQNKDISRLSTNPCLYCMTKTVHPRLGRGETYICGYKPYRCEICNYSTTTKGNLAIHQQSDKHLNNLQEHEHTVSQTIFSTTDARSSHSESPDYSRHQQHNLHQNHLHLNLPSKKSNSKCDTNIVSTYSLSERRTISSLQQNIKLDQKSIELLQNRTEHEESIDSMKMNKTASNFHEIEVTCGEDKAHPPSVSSIVDSTSFHYNRPLKPFVSLTSSYDNVMCNLTETANYPLACQVCCTFTTDNLDVLIEHVERSRIPFDIDHVTNLITVHTSGFWFCKLCTYKSPLKANFQLHCKTEKHAQRLSFLVHVCEGGLWNQSRILSTLNINENTILNISSNNNNVQSSATKELNNYISSSNATTYLSTHNNNSCSVSNNGSSSNNVKNNFNLTSSIQLYCIACDLFTTSVHKFRLHCQTLSHVGAVKIFTHLVNRRNYLWNTLASLSLFYVDLLKSLVDDSNNSSDNKNTNTQADTSLQDMNKLNCQTKFSKILLQLSSILTNLQVIYICHTNYVSFIQPSSTCSSFSSSNSNINLMSPDNLSQKSINRFKSLTSALNYWHVSEHQRSVAKQQLSTDHDNLLSHNKFTDSEYHSSEIFDIRWQLGGVEGDIEELPTMITKILIPIINDSLNKQSIKSNDYNTLTNGCIINDLELLNSKQHFTYDSKNTMDNMKDKNICNYEFVHDKMKISDLPCIQYSNIKTDRSCQIVDNDQMNSRNFKLFTECISQSNRKHISSFYKTPTTNSSSCSRSILNNSIPLIEMERNGDETNESGNIRCHSENSSTIDQRMTEDLINIEKYKLQLCNEFNNPLRQIVDSNWPTRPNSEPIFKRTNHFHSEAEINSNRSNMYKSKTYQNISHSTMDIQQQKNMAANAFLSTNRAIEDKVSTSLFLPKELHVSSEWRESDRKHLETSNASNMPSLPMHSFNLCGASITPMELFAQMTAHYKQISENYNYAQSMELLLSSTPSVTTQLSPMTMVKTGTSISIPTSTSSPTPPPPSSSSSFIVEPLTTISNPPEMSVKQIDHVNLLDNHDKMSIDDFFHEINMLPNLHSLLKQSIELIMCDGSLNLKKGEYCPEKLLAYVLEIIVNDKASRSSIYENLNNRWFKLDYMGELQMKKGNLCIHCSGNYAMDDGNDDVVNNKIKDGERSTEHQDEPRCFLLESSLELHMKLQHPKQTTTTTIEDTVVSVLNNTTVNEIIEKLNLFTSKSTFSDLFYPNLQSDCKLQPYIMSSSPNLLPINLKHSLPDNSQSVPTSLLQENGAELNDTYSFPSFVVEHKLSTKNNTTNDNTVDNSVISTICDSSIQFSSPLTASDQTDSFRKDFKNPIVNNFFETLNNSICLNNSDLLLNNTLTGKNDSIDNVNLIDKDKQMHLPLAEAFLNSIKNYDLNNPTNLLHKLYLTTQQQEHSKLLEQYDQQTASSSSQKRSRTRLSESQLNILRSYFDISNSPSDEKIHEICDKTGLQEKVVKHWFRNTLFKERQKNKDNPYNFSIPPSTSLNLEEYEKTGRIEVHSTQSVKQHHKQYYLGNEETDKHKTNNLQYESDSHDLMFMNNRNVMKNDSSIKIDYKCNNDSRNVEDLIENENATTKTSNLQVKPLTITSKRPCETESVLKNIDQMKWITQSKRLRLQKDNQHSCMNDELPASVVSAEESDVIYNYKKNVYSRTSSTENADCDFHSFVIADNSNNSHESPPSITSESSPSISETPLSPKLPLIPELDNPQSVLAALIHLGKHTHVQQQQQQFGCESDYKLMKLWEFPCYVPTSSSPTIPGLLNSAEVYTDTNKLNCQLTAFMNASLGRTVPNFQTSLDSNETPLDLSAKTTPSLMINSTDNNNCQNSSSCMTEQNIQIVDNEDNTEFTINDQDQFLSVPSLIQSEHVSNVYHSTSTTSSTNGGRRNRTSITALQSRCMHSIYNYHKTPSVHECDRLGEMIGLSRRVVQVWFQNQRAKEKKMARVTLGQYSYQLNSSSMVTDKLSPLDISSSSIDSNYCQICSISIQKSEITNNYNSGSINQQTPNNCTQSANFISHASFVDHLFSPVHLKKLIRWCTMDTN
ncbi:Zinc finger homeobox protein [Schistosoma japonicum]|uniref:Zinc finger homeobox protein n=1 Tax=Schistosoma japonicum TaxID=6182 RepID=A0A4Z2DCR8_SCHJA|nr:Zinc finger homeobox protein [Schistosoma japonicum]